RLAGACAAEREVDDAGAVVGGVDDAGGDVGHQAGTVSVENAHRHEGAAGTDAGDARAVVRVRGGDARNVGAVTVLVGELANEAGAADDLPLQIRMRGIDARIDDG